MEENEDWGELEFLEDGEVMIHSVIMNACYYLGINVRLSGNVIEFEEDSINMAQRKALNELRDSLTKVKNLK